MVPQRSRVAAVATAAAAVTAFAAAPAAHALLPEPVSQRIELQSSIGGVKLGQSLAAAQQAWGATRGSCTRDSCSFRNAGDTTGAKGDAYFFLMNGKVAGVWIAAAGKNAGKPRFTGPLVKLRTAKGIGLGTSLKALRKAHPKVKQDGASWKLTAGTRATTFYVDPASKRISYILIGRNLT